MNNTKNIAIISFHSEYEKKLIEILGSNYNININSYSPEKLKNMEIEDEFNIKKLNFDGFEVDILIIYGHDYVFYRDTKINGIELLNHIRRDGFNTPIIMLVWQEPTYFWAKDFSKRIFCTPYFKESCKILQLPLNLSELIDTFEKLKSISDNDLKLGLNYSNMRYIYHQLLHILSLDNHNSIKYKINELSKTLPYSEIIQNIKNQIINEDDINEIKNIIQQNLKN